VILKLTKFLKTYLKHYNYEQKIRSFAASLPEPLYYELKDLNQMKGNHASYTWYDSFKNISKFIVLYP
jgi:hypothetical protein